MSLFTPRVVYWNNIPSPYVVDRFNALADNGTVLFEGWFNEPTHSDRSWRVDETSWRFEGRYLPHVRTPLGPLALAQSALKAFRPHVLISLFSEPSFMMGWFQARRMGVKTLLRVMSPSPTLHPRHPVKEAAKQFMFRRADGLLVAGADARAYAFSYGIPDTRLHRETQAIDAAFFIERGEREKRNRERTREDLGLTGTVFVYVGRLLCAKGLDRLIDAFATVQETFDSSLLLVGDGPDEAELRELAVRHGLENVVFAGFQASDDLPTFLAAADVFVLPSLGDAYGLVIDEAMAVGLPVIASAAVGEVRERVRQGETGYVVEGTATELAEHMAVLARNPGGRMRMGSKAQRLMEGRRPSLWAADIEAAVAAVLRNGAG